MIRDSIILAAILTLAVITSVYSDESVKPKFIGKVPDAATAKVSAVTVNTSAVSNITPGSAPRLDAITLAVKQARAILNAPAAATARIQSAGVKASTATNITSGSSPRLDASILDAQHDAITLAVKQARASLNAPAELDLTNRPSPLTAALAYQEAGDTAGRDAAITGAGLTLHDTAKARPLPRFFVALNGYGIESAQSSANFSATDYPVMAVRLSLYSVQPGVVDYVLAHGDRKYVLIVDERGLTDPAYKLLNAPNVIAVVVGHYMAGDPESIQPDGYRDSVVNQAATIRLACGKPVLLAVPWVQWQTYASGKEWVDRIGTAIGGFDGFAVFSLVSFAGMEDKTPSTVREQLGLPDKPLVLLDFMGWSGQIGKERAEAIWKGPGLELLNRLASDGWSGAVLMTMDAADLKAKSAQIQADATELIYKP